MKKIISILFFIFAFNNIHAQVYYTPFIRDNSPFYQTGPRYQPRYQEDRIQYRRFTGTTKSGYTAPFRIKYINGYIRSIEYYDSTYKDWMTCMSFSHTNKGLIYDDYEKVYDYKVQPTFDSEIYYF